MVRNCPLRIRFFPAGRVSGGTTVCLVNYRHVPRPPLRRCSPHQTLYLACSSAPPVSAGPLAAEVIQVFFSPHGGATEAVVRELGNAKKEILVQAYSFTSAPIAKALVDAHKRGVKVTVVLDRVQRSKKYSSADFVANAGIPTYIDAKHAIAHNKIMIIDGRR